MGSPISVKQKALNTWAIILIIWSFYRALFKTELPLWIDELIIKPTLFIVPVLLFIRRIHKENIIFNLKLNVHKKIYYGIFAGSIFLLFIIKQSQSLFWYYLIISLGTSFSEEILSRGFILKQIYHSTQNKVFAIIQSTLLSLCLHIPILLTNDSLTGLLLLQVIALDFLLGIATSILYLEEQSLIPPIILHAVYSLSLYLFT